MDEISLARETSSISRDVPPSFEHYRNINEPISHLCVSNHPLITRHLTRKQGRDTIGQSFSILTKQKDKSNKSSKHNYPSKNLYINLTDFQLLKTKIVYTRFILTHKGSLISFFITSIQKELTKNFLYSTLIVLFEIILFTNQIKHFTIITKLKFYRRNIYERVSSFGHIYLTKDFCIRRLGRERQ